jgi:hypothetical protein
MSKLLLNEQPLLVMPQLAVKIGLNESIILQQIHYWNEINKKAKHNLKDGYYWTFNSYNDWMNQFPFWSVSTIKRSIHKLESIGLIVCGNYNKLKIDRTKWYRIRYEVLEHVETYPLGQIDPTNDSDWHEHLAKVNLTIPETNTESITKTNRNIILSNDAQLFLQTFENYFGYKHRIVKAYVSLETDDFSDEELTDLFEEYFDKYSNGDQLHDMEKCSINNVFKSFERIKIGCGW